MIIVKTPNRVSLFGGGSDYPAYYENHQYGVVVGFGIDKYSWLIVDKNSPFLDFKTHLAYSKIERVQENKDIEHNVIRAVLDYLKINYGVVALHHSDLPSRSGLGSSSTFTVGLLHALQTLDGKRVLKHILAEQAIDIEQNVLKENVGSQDQIWAAYGGLNIITLTKQHFFNVTPIHIRELDLKFLESHMMLVFTGLSRTASDVAKQYIELTPDKIKRYGRMKEIAQESIRYVFNADIEKIGDLLRESWAEKKGIAQNITNQHIDDMHDKIMGLGAYGTKLLGAGNGGFLFVLAPPPVLSKIKQEFNGYTCVDIKVDLEGSKVVHQ